MTSWAERTGRSSRNDLRTKGTGAPVRLPPEMEEEIHEAWEREVFTPPALAGGGKGRLEFSANY